VVSACVSPAAAKPALDVCAPPRTRIALCPLADVTDHAWTVWTGEQPATLVARRLADSLERAHGRRVVPLGSAGQTPARPLEDERALELGRVSGAEVVLSGAVLEFTQDDRREPGKFSRWGVAAPEARSFAGVRVALRALDTADGSVVLETTIARERRSRSTASAGRPGAKPVQAAPSGTLAEALDEVISDLARALDRGLTDRWSANVVGAVPGLCLLDAGAGHGLFAGLRLEIWRDGIETWDEELTRLDDSVLVGVVVVSELEGRDRARARVVEGDVRAGDRVRPCTAAPPPPVSLRR